MPNKRLHFTWMLGVIIKLLSANSFHKNLLHLRSPCSHVSTFESKAQAQLKNEMRTSLKNPSRKPGGNSLIKGPLNPLTIAPLHRALSNQNPSPKTLAPALSLSISVSLFLARSLALLQWNFGVSRLFPCRLLFFFYSFSHCLAFLSVCSFLTVYVLSV